MERERVRLEATFHSICDSQDSSAPDAKRLKFTSDALHVSWSALFDSQHIVCTGIPKIVK